MTPRRAWWVRGCNVMLAPIARRPAGFAEIRRAAARDAGADVAADGFEDGMRTLYESWMDAPLTPIGRLGARDEVRRRLANAYALQALVGTHPEVAAAPIARPVVVTGLPRTGTTLLHGLLARHPAARAPLLWELMFPLPATPRQRRRHVRTARRSARLYHAAVPAVRDIHPLAADAPEECFFALPHTYAHVVRTPMPEYQRWYAAREFDADYRHLYGLLQALQWRSPARRWVLKSPLHLFHLDVLLRVFPDATVVWTHRDPVRALTSWCSFVEAVRILQHAAVDPATIGPEWLELWAGALTRAASVRAASPGRFLDVAYDDLTADPVGTATRLWERIGEPAGAYAHTATRPHRTGRHTYVPERYGLTAEKIRSAIPEPLLG